MTENTRILCKDLYVVDYANIGPNGKGKNNDYYQVFAIKNDKDELFVFSRNEVLEINKAKGNSIYTSTRSFNQSSVVDKDDYYTSFGTLKDRSAEFARRQTKYNIRGDYDRSIYFNYLEVMPLGVVSLGEYFESNEIFKKMIKGINSDKTTNATVTVGEILQVETTRNALIDKYIDKQIKKDSKRMGKSAKREISNRTFEFMKNFQEKKITDEYSSLFANASRASQNEIIGIDGDGDNHNFEEVSNKPEKSQMEDSQRITNSQVIIGLDGDDAEYEYNDELDFALNLENKYFKDKTSREIIIGLNGSEEYSDIEIKKSNYTRLYGHENNDQIIAGLQGDDGM